MGTIGKRRGLSLAEAVVALFLLTAGVLVAMGAFVKSIRYQRESVQLRQAALEAENVMTALRLYRDGFASSGQSWTQYWDHYKNEGEAFVLPPYRGRVRVQQLQVYSPCSSTEQGYQLQARRLEQSAVQAVVDVTWGDGRRNLRFATQIAPPPPAVESLSLRRLDSGLVARDGFARYQVEARDAAGRRVEGICFSWRVDADASTHQPGMATLVATQNRVAEEILVYHRLYRPDLAITYAGGRTRLTAYCRANGRVVSSSDSLELAP